MADQVLQYALTGDASGAKTAFADVGASIARAAEQTDKAAKSVSDLAAKLDRSAAAAGRAATDSNKASLALSSLGQGATYAAEQIPGVGGALAAVAQGPMIAVVAGATAITAAFAGAVKSGIDFADSLNDLSDRLGVPIETLSRLAPVADLGGTSLESLAVVLGKFAQKVSTGDKGIRDLHLSTTDAVGAMIEIADKVQAAGSQTEAIAIAQAAYGKQWQELMPVLKMGGSYIKKTMSEAAVVTAETAAQAAKIKDEFTLLKNKTLNISIGIAENVMPQIELWLEGVEKIRKAMGLITFDEKKAIERTAIIAKYADQQQRNREAGLNGAPSWFLQKIGANKINGKTLEQALAEIDAKYTAPASAPTGPAPLSAEEIAALQKELAFRRDLKLSLDVINADADDREVQQIRGKYAKLRQEHKQFAESIRLINEAELSEIVQYNIKQSSALQEKADKAFFDATGIDWQTYSLLHPGGNESEQGAQSLTLGMSALRRDDILSKIRSSGIGQISGNQWTYQTKNGNFSDYRQVDLTSETTQNLQREFQTASDAEVNFVKQSRENAEAFQAQWQGVYNSISETIATNLGPALIDLFSRPQDALEELGNVGKKILSDLATQLLEVGLKWAILSAFAGGAGGKSPGTFLSFLSKSFGGHADGTLSSPGGLKYLGEQGPELVTTPMGSRYMASYGLYHVPSGTRVEKTAAAPVTFAPQINVMGTSDPAQTAAMVDRRIRELYAEIQSDEYRGRIS